jgi:hypothetical protein
MMCFEWTGVERSGEIEHPLWVKLRVIIVCVGKVCVIMCGEVFGGSWVCDSSRLVDVVCDQRFVAVR